MDDKTVYSLFSTGHEYFDKGQFDKALDNFERSLEISEQIGEKPLIARNCNRIGAVHSDKGNYNKAEQYIKKSLRVHKELGEGVHASLTTASNFIFVAPLIDKILQKRYYEKEKEGYTASMDDNQKSIFSSRFDEKVKKSTINNANIAKANKKYLWSYYSCLGAIGLVLIMDTIKNNFLLLV